MEYNSNESYESYIADLKIQVNMFIKYKGLDKFKRWTRSIQVTSKISLYEHI